MELRQRTKQKKKPLIFLKEWHVHFKGGSPFLYLGEFNESGYACSNSPFLVVYDLKRKTFSSYRYGMQTFISKEEDDIIKWEDWIKENPHHEKELFMGEFMYRKETDVGDAKKLFVKEILREYKLRKILNN